MNLSRVPALPLLAGSVVGILLATEVDAGFIVTVICLILALLCRWRRFIFAALFCLAIGLGIFMTVLRTPESVSREITQRPVKVSAKIEKPWGDASGKGYIAHITAIDGNATHFNTFMVVLRQRDKYIAGDSVVTTGIFIENDPVTDLPDETNLYKPLYREGAVTTFFTEGDSVSFSQWRPSFFQRLEHDSHRFLMTRITDMGCNASTTAFLMAVVAGDDSAMESWRQDNYRTVGIAHVLALSGLHIGVIVWLAMILVNIVMNMPRGRVVGYLLLAVIILLYTVATGMSPSACRAMVMVVVFIIAKLLGRKPSPYNSLFVSVFIWLIINPFWLYSPGLQLSAVAVLAIIALTPLFVNPNWPSFMQKSVGMVVVPIVAITGTTMVSAMYFHSIPLWFLPMNVIAGIIVPLMVAGGVVGVLITACGLKLGWIAFAFNLMHDLLDRSVSFFATLPGGVIENVYPQWWHWGLYLVAVAVLGCAACWRSRRMAFSGFVILLTIFLMFTDPVEVDNTNALYIPRRFHYTDILVRQDNQLFLFSNGTGAREYAEHIYADYMAARGIDSVTLVSKEPPLISFGNRTFLLQTKDTIMYHTTGVDYLVIGNGFKGNAVQAARCAKADTVLIAASLNPRRGTRYLQQLKQAGIPARSHHDIPFVLIAP